MIRSKSGFPFQKVYVIRCAGMEIIRHWIEGDVLLYGLQLDANPAIYYIDKTDCSVDWLGDTGEFGGAGSGYGMDYSDEDETMYITAYDSFSFNSNF